MPFASVEQNYRLRPASSLIGRRPQLLPGIVTALATCLRGLRGLAVHDGRRSGRFPTVLLTDITSQSVVQTLPGPLLRQRAKSSNMVDFGGKSCGSISHEQPVRSRYKIAFTISRRSTVRSRPPPDAGGNSRSPIPHCSSDKSDRYARRAEAPDMIGLPVEMNSELTARSTHLSPLAAQTTYLSRCPVNDYSTEDRHFLKAPKPQNNAQLATETGAVRLSTTAGCPWSAP